MQPTHFEIPEQMREVADKSVDQARQAFDQFLAATQKALSTAEGSAKTVSEGAADLSRQSLAYVEENVTASFDLARRMVQARTVQEIAALQQEFLRQQMKAMTEQGRTLGEMAGRLAAESQPKPRK
jgi:phasin